MYAEKLGCKAEALCRALWGDYSFLAKERRVVRATRKGASKLKAMFVQFALEPIWKVRSADCIVRKLHTGHARLALAVPAWHAACGAWMLHAVAAQRSKVLPAVHACLVYGMLLLTCRPLPAPGVHGM